MDLPFLLPNASASYIAIGYVSILILMDLPFLYSDVSSIDGTTTRFNPYSNGSSFFIH